MEYDRKAHLQILMGLQFEVKKELSILMKTKGIRHEGVKWKIYNLSY